MDLDQVRAKLSIRQKELSERLDRIARHTRNREEPLPQDFAEQAVELENQELLEALDGEIVDELRMIQSAVARLEANIYLSCKGCGEEIPEARLVALPVTDLCVACAQVQERQEQ